MFGILWGTFMLVGKSVNNLKEIFDNCENKKTRINKDGLTYCDSKSRSRLISNDRLAYYTRDNNQYKLIETKSGDVVKNFTDENIEKEIRNNKLNAIKNNNTTYCIDTIHCSNKLINGIQGKRFKDIKTGDIYVIRIFNYKYYYLNCKTGEIVRKTDNQIMKEKTNMSMRITKDIDIYQYNKEHTKINPKNISDFFYNTYWVNSCDYNK